MSLQLAYFGLPLGALLLCEDGHSLSSCVLSPIAAPGRRRLRARLGERVLDAAELGAEWEHVIDAALSRSTPDLLVSWFWTRRLSERWLRTPRLDAIGAHPSLLPRHRGPNPFFWAIDAGDARTGVSVHRLEAEYDTGPVLLTESIPVGDKNAWQLARALDRPSLRTLRRAVASYAQGHLPFATPQDAALATQAPDPSGADLRADFRWNSERVLRRIRALAPVPGLALEVFGFRFFVTAAHASEAFVASLEPGEAELLPGGVQIRTGDGAIAIDRAFHESEDEGDVDGQLHAAELAQRLLAAGKAFKDRAR